ncbi:MAG: zinc ribbon domain-containing protein [Gammaproteobacteria bacterium]|nr:zinc ribbon domain-containing protein [Gammaproteobacteria bacterium]
MPFYEYRCDACGHQLEALQKISDAPLSDCPECEKPELTKLVSAVGFRLKGGGWYETDFKGGAKKDGAESPAKDASGGHSCGTGSCPACS